MTNAHPFFPEADFRADQCLQDIRQLTLLPAVQCKRGTYPIS
jgi:hypothetical protein